MKIAIIAAMGENRAIGFQGKIPWHLPADFKHFKELTMGHPIIEGSKTFESIGKALPGRTNIVIARDMEYKAEGCLVAHSFDEALGLAERSEGANEVFVCGGGQIYALALPRAEVLYVTKVRGIFEGDVFFPELDERTWHLVGEEKHSADEKNAFEYSFCVYERIA